MPKEGFRPLVNQQLRAILQKKGLPQEAIFDEIKIGLAERFKNVITVFIAALGAKALNPIKMTLDELAGIEPDEIPSIKQQLKKAWESGKKASEYNVTRW